MLANEDNFKEYMKQFGRKPLVAPAREPTIDELIAEGNKLLAAEATANSLKKVNNAFSSKSKEKSKPIDDSKKLNTALAKTSENPYVKAHALVLEKLLKNPKTAWLAKVIEQIEKKEIPPNRQYNEFVKEVEILGDKLSENK